MLLGGVRRPYALGMVQEVSLVLEAACHNYKAAAWA